jgi:hypothetical protein
VDLMSDDPVLPVLLALRLRSFATSEVVSERSGLESEVVLTALKECSESGWASFREGRVTGWSLTADGRRRGEELLAQQLDSAGVRVGVEAAYERFLGLNGELLSICTDWQVVGPGSDQRVNDHADAAHDAAVLVRLDTLHASALPVTADLGRLLVRFDTYSARLAHAHDRVCAGEHDWLTRPTIDSYHTVWFELHEDLLATLGRERSQERP